MPNVGDPTPAARPGPLATAYSSTGAGPGGNIAGAASPSPAAAPAAPAAPPAAPYDPYDYTSDPLYQQILAQGQQAREQANAAAISQETQSAIDYGDPDLVRSLGLGEDTAQRAANNPYSILAQLAQNEQRAPAALDESLNKQNLFYSGYRGTKQSELAQSLGQNRYNAWQAEQGKLGGIQSTLAGSLSGIAGQENEAASAAAARRQAQLGDLPQTVPGPTVAGAKPLPTTSRVGSALTRAATPRVKYRY